LRPALIDEPVGCANKGNDMTEHEVCSKCGCEEILTIQGNIWLGGAGSNIPVGWRDLNAVPVTRLVCASCGLNESWVSDQKDLEKTRVRVRAVRQGMKSRHGRRSTSRV